MPQQVHEGRPGCRWRAAALRRLALASAALAVAACGESDGAAAPAGLRFDTTRLCALVPARDPAAAAFPPTPPVRVFGTDLGWTYERDGVVTMLFGDSWQRIDICPLQLNDDSLATLQLPAADWPGYTAQDSLPDAQCPQLTFPVDAAGTAFAPIELRLWDGTVIPLGPLNTPVTGFFDGQREWAVFIVGGGQACTAADAASGAPCPTDLSAPAAELACGTVGGRPLCVDPTSIRHGDGAQAYYLYFAERVGPTAYMARAALLTNGEFEPVNHAAISYVEPLRRWLMIYGGASTDFLDVDGSGGQTQPVRGAMHARFGTEAWGPWSDPEPVLTEQQAGQDIVCGRRAPAGCLPKPVPRIRPACLEAFDPTGGGNLYGANIIDVMTRRSRAASGRGAAADIFWNYSTWHPYTVVLVRTHVEAE